ncbi:hypothetical protein [Chryseobacterium sp.]|uniref:hypothetical protein n=1 Tax=Chryseobacterium sp. TaxID=1871047 RepID=UPI00388CF3DA
MKKYIFLYLLLICGLLSLQAQCKMVYSISENFDAWTVIQPCWYTQSGLSMIYVKNKRITFYSMMTPREDMHFITPKLKAGEYSLSVDFSDNGGESTLQLFSIENTSNQKSFISIAKPSPIKKATRVQNITLKKNAHLGLKVVLNDMHQAIYMDNLIIKPRK